MANLFSGVKDPLIQGTGTLTDYQTTADERFASEWEGALDQNPLAQGARMARYAVENNAPFFGLESNMVSPEVARQELKSRGLDTHLTVPEGGISRVELDSIQYLKQRELARQAKGAMNQSMFSHLSGFAGGLAGSAIDPINIASAFVPIVPEARLLGMLGKAGSSTLGRAAVRAQVGAAEGAVGALMIEPFTYAMAQYEQMDYTPVDSFMNVVFGTVLGGGLHMAGGAVYDWRATRALNSLQTGLDAMSLRDMAPDAQDATQLDILRRFTEAEENGTPPPDADEILSQRLTPDQRDEMRAAEGLPDEVPGVARADGQPSQPRGLNELIPEAKADRTAETFDRQFLDKEQGDVSGFGDVRPPREDIFEVAEANFAGRTAHSAKTIPIDQLKGGVSTDPAETKRVNNLVDLMSAPNGYLERLIVDTDGNVIEGQHRLEALRKMGIKEVPVIEIRELRENLPVDQMMDAMQEVRGLHRDQARQIIDQIAEAIADVGSVAEVRAQYAPPRGFERAWEAALDAAEAGDMRAQSDAVDDAAGPSSGLTPYNDTLGGKTDVNQPQSPDVLGTQERGLRLLTGVRRSPGILPPSPAWSDTAPLAYLPTTIKVPGVGTVEAGAFPLARKAARDYVESRGRPYDPITTYRKVDPARAGRIAEAFEQMRHEPDNPEVKAAYEAMVKETLAQWDVVKRTGLVVEFIDISKGDPYAASPRLATEDVRNNNHLWVFATDDGFGTEGITAKDESDNPLFQLVPGETISGKSVRANDIFRIVHDYFGHIKDGVGFRADGEENAWRSHSRMYSPQAARAMTTETRGQNSWLNYGPHGEKNRTALTQDTIFAEQKIGLMPDWVLWEGLDDLPLPVPAEPRTLADELGFGDLKMMGEPLDPADGPDAPKVIGTDAVGRPVLDFRNSVVSHFTDQESADNINEFGYRAVGDGYYGEAISFTPDRSFGAQFGGVETTARISPDARILNTGVPEDAQMIQSVLNNRHLVPNNPRPGLRSWRQEFLRLGIDGLYDPGAGDLFIYNERVVKPTAMEGLGDLKTMIAGEKALTADLAARDAADELLGEGDTDLDEIWRRTGWGRSPDNFAIWEIDDSKSEVTDFDAMMSGKEVTLGSVFKHDELYEAYPGLRNVRVIAKDKMDLTAEIDLIGNPPTIYIRKGADKTTVHSTLLHEINHAVQEIEGFQSGGNPKTYGYSGYNRLIGEVASRNVQNRIDFDKATRRRTPLSDTEDIPDHLQLRPEDIAAMERQGRYMRFQEVRKTLDGTWYPVDGIGQWAEVGYPTQKEAQDALRNLNAEMDAAERRASTTKQTGAVMDEDGGIDDLKTMLGGKPVAPDTPEFKRWFGGSKAVDESGNPQIYYHSTTGDFNSFDISRSSPGAAYGQGIYMTLDRNDTGWARGVGHNVMPLFVKMENPLDTTKPLTEHEASALRAVGMDWVKAGIPTPLTTMERRFGYVGAAAKAAGFDALVHTGPRGQPHLLVFNETQVKSAIGNRGTYDPDLADIRAQSDIKETATVMDEDGGIEVWHGSPHDFDRFDIRKIGTGEGAQAYSRGLYFGQARGTGERYRDMLVERPNPDRLSLQKIWALENEELSDRLLKGIEMAVENSIIDERPAPKWADVVRDLRSQYGKDPDFNLAIKTFEESGFKDEFDLPRGKLYKAKLKVRPEELIDWDKPLSQQAEVLQKIVKSMGGIERLKEAAARADELAQQTLDKVPGAENEFFAFRKTPEARLGTALDSMNRAMNNKFLRDGEFNRRFTGEWLINALGRDDIATEAMRRAGYKGVQYFDQLSRADGTGEKTRNYVVFDDEIIDIIDKFQMDLDEQPDLVAAHNLTAANLLHADKMGGIAAPSLAIAKASDGHEGYGEITLIGSKDLVDPQKGANVFAGDIYSARYPDVHHDFTYANLKKFTKRLQDEVAEMGYTVPVVLDSDALERTGSEGLTNTAAVMLVYAKQKGIKIDVPVFDQTAWKAREEEARKVMDGINQRRNESIEREVALAEAEGREPNTRDINYEYGNEYTAARRKFDAIRMEPPMLDLELQRKLTDRFRNDDEFREWTVEKFGELKAKERIFKGWSDTSGRKLYAPHTLDNVIRLMSKKIRDAEGFNYGIGNLRAKVAPKFRSVEAIRGRKGSLVKREEFDAIKQEADAELVAVFDVLQPKVKYQENRFMQLNNLTLHMAEAVDRNNVKRVFQEYYNDLTDDDVRMVGNFLQKLKTMPTTYFEAKLDRAVQIGEFEAAIVPNTLSKKAREVLERSGVKQIIEYDPSVDGARQAAIDSVRDMKFQSDLLRDLGFFSAMEKSIKEADLKSGTGAQWLGYLKNRPGVKAEELDNSGISDFLTENANEKLTRDQVLARAKDGAVELNETTSMDGRKLFSDEQLAKIKVEIDALGFGPGLSEFMYEGVKAGSQGAIDQAKKYIDPDLLTPRGFRPKFEQYTLPGGENYREVLLTLPAKPDVVYTKDNIIQLKQGDRDWADDHDRFWYFLAPDNSYQILKKDHPTQQGARDYIIANKQPEPPENRQFKSTHFTQGNILAHARISDRVTASGKKALHVEEIQSDWHQSGREKGYASQGDLNKFRELDAKMQVAREAIAVEQKRLLKKLGFDGYLQLLKEGTKEDAAKYSLLKIEDKEYFAANNALVKLERERKAANPVNKVADAPFKKTWHELMLKRLIRMAVEKGYDDIIITRGQDIAERFDLSKHISEVRYEPIQVADGSPPLFEISVFDKKGGKIIEEEEADEKRLSELIGKELTAKILRDEGRPYKPDGGYREWRTLDGLDLKVGGEGMKGFYDKIVPDFLNKYGKKYGAKVGTDMIDTEAADANLGTVAVHAFPITDAMRTEVMKGQMLFQRDVVDVKAKDQIKAGPYTYTKMDTERRQRSEALQDAINGLISKYTGGRSETRWYSSISQRVGGKIHKVDGGYSPLRGVIVMALDAADMIGSAKHEALHFLKDRGLISDMEWDNLVRTALRQGWLDKKYGGSKNTIRERYSHLSLIDQIEEAIAEEFRAGRYDGFQGYPPAVRAVLVKLRKFFDAVAKEARKIFGAEATVEDIFRAIESGEIGRRADVEKGKVETAAIMDAPQRSAPQRMKNQSTPEEDPLRVDRWAADDVAIAAGATEDGKRKDETLQDIEADTAILGAHLESMRQRGLLSQEDEADMLASNDTARVMEEQAAAYEAAGICEGEE